MYKLGKEKRHGPEVRRQFPVFPSFPKFRVDPVVQTRWRRFGEKSKKESEEQS